MKYKVIRTDTADAGIRKIILYVAHKNVVIYAVVDQRQDYLNIVRGL